MSTATIPAIQRRITVNVPVERAFHVFTSSLHTWWPQTFHIGAVEMERPVLEPRAGGRWYERGVDGSECDWGSVVVWDPPGRIVLTWQIDGEWQYDADPAHASEIEVLFVADGPERTVVELEHRHIGRLAHAEALASSVSGDGGWSLLLSRLAIAAGSDT